MNRPRRLRQTLLMRDMCRETRISPKALIYPLFIQEGSNIKEEIPSLVGQYHYSPDRVCDGVESALEAGVNKFLLFGLPKEKDPLGSGAYAADGVVQEGLRAIRTRYPEVMLITDVCMCEYTSHGHCGILSEVFPSGKPASRTGKISGRPDGAAFPERKCTEPPDLFPVRDEHSVDNDKTLPYLAEIALSHAQAGADIVAPSDMMDGRVAAIRQALDREGYVHTAIMSYAVKYASAFYGPFREAAGSAPAFGDRKSYQMDCHNKREAVKEALLDVEEGADLLIVKPALAYLDIIQSVSRRVNIPVAAYNVSGEYAMIKAAGIQGLIDEYQVMCESAVSMFRAGAQILITYFAKELASAIQKGDIG